MKRRCGWDELAVLLYCTLLYIFGGTILTLFLAVLFLLLNPRTTSLIAYSGIVILHSRFVSIVEYSSCATTEYTVTYLPPVPVVWFLPLSPFLDQNLYPLSSQTLPIIIRNWML